MRWTSSIPSVSFGMLAFAFSYILFFSSHISKPGLRTRVNWLHEAPPTFEHSSDSQQRVFHPELQNSASAPPRTKRQGEFFCSFDRSTKRKYDNYPYLKARHNLKAAPNGRYTDGCGKEKNNNIPALRKASRIDKHFLRRVTCSTQDGICVRASRGQQRVPVELRGRDLTNGDLSMVSFSISFRRSFSVLSAPISTTNATCFAIFRILHLHCCNIPELYQFQNRCTVLAKFNATSSFTTRSIYVLFNQIFRIAKMSNYVILIQKAPYYHKFSENLLKFQGQFRKILGTYFSKSTKSKCSIL